MIIKKIIQHIRRFLLAQKNNDATTKKASNDSRRQALSKLLATGGAVAMGASAGVANAHKVKRTEEKEERFALLSLDDHYYLKLYKVDKGAIPTKKPKVPVLSFRLDVDDFSDAITELERKKIHIVEGPITTSKGESLLFQDPSGNLIELYYEEEEESS